MEVVATAPAAQHPQNGAPTSHGESGSSVDAHGGSDAQKETRRGHAAQEPHARPLPRRSPPSPIYATRTGYSHIFLPQITRFAFSLCLHP
jgi:hypothetical protein